MLLLLTVKLIQVAVKLKVLSLNPLTTNRHPELLSVPILSITDAQCSDQTRMNNQEVLLLST